MGSISVVKQDADILVYPNPANNENTIQVYLGKLQNIEINIVDLSGKRVRQVIDEKDIYGTLRYTTNLENLMHGMYLYQVKTSSNVYYVKFLKQ